MSNVQHALVGTAIEFAGASARPESLGVILGPWTRQRRVESGKTDQKTAPGVDPATEKSCLRIWGMLFEGHFPTIDHGTFRMVNASSVLHVSHLYQR